MSKVNCEHQWRTGVSQGMFIPILKWERITMDFVVGLSTIVGSYETIFVDIKKMTKSSYFIQILLKYTTGILSQLCITQIVCIHGARISIVFE